jgi:hypothetical protein
METTLLETTIQNMNDVIRELRKRPDSDSLIEKLEAITNQITDIRDYYYDLGYDIGREKQSSIDDNKLLTMLKITSCEN